MYCSFINSNLTKKKHLTEFHYFFLWKKKRINETPLPLISNQVEVLTLTFKLFILERVNSTPLHPFRRFTFRSRRFNRFPMQILGQPFQIAIANERIPTQMSKKKKIIKIAKINFFKNVLLTVSEYFSANRNCHLPTIECCCRKVREDWDCADLWTCLYARRKYRWRLITWKCLQFT